MKSKQQTRRKNKLIINLYEIYKCTEREIEGKMATKCVEIECLLRFNARSIDRLAASRLAHVTTPC